MDFLPEHLYHVYNRGNNKEKVFYSDKNYSYFLDKLEKHILPYADILAYCLMPNHFHLLILTHKDLNGGEINRNIGVLLRSYTRAINIQESREGSLFQQKTKAKCLNKAHRVLQSHLMSNYDLACFNYIHQNPLKAGLVAKIEDWQYSSFGEYLGLNKRKICNVKLAYGTMDLPKQEKLYKLTYEAINDERFKNIF